ncbi:hypothetical protein [uncultured Marinobacter sp.]|uniref:hypothetical protein n=1 Tax=uncultured Marinobacter sp. TaxID=187379 RepID=UPI00261ED153|nr:hypothetical protein [uncultured Marinobacter sp.]
MKIVFALLLLPFLAACSNSEKEARTLLNQGIQEWDRGELAQALATFDRINTQYLDTVAATEALKERAARFEDYRARSSSEHNREINSGAVSRDVYKQVEAYFGQAGHYPAALAGNNPVYKGRFEAYINQCTYQSPLPDYGYQLDCTRADEAYLADRTERLRKAAEKRKAARSRSSGENSESPAIKTATDLKVSKNTWGAYLNPTNKLPKDGFQAFYINTNEPRTVIATESVDNIAINYIRDELHGIESRDFGGYWVGNLEFDTQEVRRISVSQSWSKTRILINGGVLYEGGSDASILYRFEPGLHQIEVEYVNNWHTTELSVDINSEVAYYDLNEINAQLKANLLGDYQVYYASVYESSSKDLMTVVNMQKTARPVLLVLSSYSPVKWYLSNPFGADVRAVVYGSYKPGSTLAGDISDSALRFPARTRIGSYDVSPKCHCVAGNFHCEGTSMMTTVNALKALTGMPLTGFTGKYSAASLRLPEVKVDDRYLEDLKTTMSKIGTDRQACKSKNDPDFEAMFDGDA